MNVICIVPVKNESWILRQFIESARQWASHIIIGDHNSSDDSAAIARQYDCVTLVPLINRAFDAAARRRLLFNEARRIPGRKLIVSIDADEMFSANWSRSPEWRMMLNSPPGTRFSFDWLEIKPGLQEAAVFSQEAALVDDGREYQGDAIHEPRIPAGTGPTVHLKEIKLLHFILIDQERMLSKHRWYKCVELLELGKRPWPICIMYQSSQSPTTYDAPLVPMDVNWTAGWDWLEEYRREPLVQKAYWYDEYVLRLFHQHGVERFRKLNI